MKNDALQVATLDLNIEVLDHRVELLAAAAGTCSTTSCCSSTVQPANPVILAE